MELIYRPLTEDNDDVFLEITEPLYRSSRVEINKRKTMLVYKESTPVGWLYMNLPDNKQYDVYVFVYVAPVWRRQGIGTEIFRYTKTKMEGYTGGWWVMYPEMEAADPFARRMGAEFVNSNYHMVYAGGCPELLTEGIRPYHEETDFPAAPEIWNREYANLHKRLGLPDVEPEILTEDDRNDYREFAEVTYVIEEDHKIVGIGGLFSEGDGIGMLAVDAAYTGKGLGTRLAVFLTEESIRRGYSNPHLYCEDGNDNALHIYEKIGYRKEYCEKWAMRKHI
ncbi:MAG: GNAT family N-acetyltransferase [Clostridia bacterium]|nr:GNAT family N-acetyltransferase [Clostridia bacterium]